MINLNKKILSLVIVLVLLTGCVSKGSHNIENKPHNKKIDTRVEGNKKKESQSDKEVDKENQKETEKETQTRESQNKKIEEKEEERIEIDENRFSLEELFSKDIGATYMYSGSKGFKKVEKFIYLNYPYQSPSKYYEFTGLDYNNMKEGKAKVYQRTYDVSIHGDKIEESGIEGFLVNEETALKKKSWIGFFNSQMYGEIWAEKLVTKWDDENLILKVKALPRKGVEVPKGYEEEYTFQKGRGIVSINIKNGETEEQETIVVNEMNPSMRLAHQVKLWKDIPKEYIEEVSGLNGYFYIKEAFFKELNRELQEKINHASKEEQEKIFREYLNKMPEDSLNSIKNISPMAEIMYNSTKDVYYLIQGINEYERRVEAINKIHNRDEFTLPKLGEYIHFHRDYMTHKYLGLKNLEDEEEIRVNIYIDNMMEINPEYGGTKVFDYSKKFLKNYAQGSAPREFMEYLKFRAFIYEDDYNHYLLNSRTLADVMVVIEEAAVHGKIGYKGCLEEMFKELIKPEIKNGKVTRKYLYKLNCYLSYGPMINYFEEVSKIKNLIGKSMSYTRDLNDYLNELAVMGVDEEIMNSIERQAEEKKIEIQQYARTKENYVELDEVDTSNAVEVWTESEFLEAIKDGAVIKVMDDIFIHSAERTISNKVTVSRWGVGMNGIENLTIIGDGDYPVNIAIGSSDDAIRIYNCRNIRIRNISIGHTNRNCTGPVMTATDSSLIKVEDSIIYGCGYIGLSYNEVKDIEVKNTLIWDCQQEGILFNGVEGGELNNVVITANGVNQPNYHECKDIKEINVRID